MGKGELASALYWLPWIKSGKFWAGVLVVIGIAGELLGDRLEAPLENIVEKAHQSEMAQLRKGTAEANARAAEANQKAEQERLARIQLEAAISPILLSEKDVEEIADACRLFGKSHLKVGIETMSMTGDDFSLALQIRDALIRAGFDVDIPEATGRVRNGVNVSGPIDIRTRLAL